MIGLALGEVLVWFAATLGGGVAFLGGGVAFLGGGVAFLGGGVACTLPRGV